MTLAVFVRLFKERFESEVSKKTGWGKNEVIKQMNKVMDKLVLEALDEKEEK